MFGLGTKDNLSRTVTILDRAVDHETLERITSHLNKNIGNFLESFGIHHGDVESSEETPNEEPVWFNLTDGLSYPVHPSAPPGSWMLANKHKNRIRDFDSELRKAEQDYDDDEIDTIEYKARCNSIARERAVSNTESTNFDLEHAKNAVAYEDGDISLEQHLGNYRALLLSEILKALQTGSPPPPLPSSVPDF